MQYLCDTSTYSLTPAIDCPGYDLWVAHLSNDIVPYIWERPEIYGEESWIYTLDSAFSFLVYSKCDAPCVGW